MDSNIAGRARVVGRGGRGWQWGQEQVLGGRVGRGQEGWGRGGGVIREGRRAVSNEIRATLTDNVINHGLTMREAGLRAQSFWRCVLQQHLLRMKQLYTVPFERNSDWVKDLRQDYVEVCMRHYFQYFKLPDTEPEHWAVPYLLICIFFWMLQSILEMDAHAVLHEYIYVDEGGFSLTKTRRRGRSDRI